MGESRATDDAEEGGRGTKEGCERYCEQEVSVGMTTCAVSKSHNVTAAVHHAIQYIKCHFKTLTKAFGV